MLNRPLVIIALLLASSAIAGAATISDGAFSNWSFTILGNGAMSVEPSGGNPGARLNMTTTTSLSSTVYGLGTNLDFSTAEALSGIFSLNLDVLSGLNDFGAGQSISLLVQQGSDIYLQFLGNTGAVQNTFTPMTFQGSFIAASFTHLVGAGAATPNLAGGTSTFFGLGVINSSNNRTLTKYYDNYSLTYTSTAPEPSTMLLFGLAALGLAAFRTRKRQ